MSLWSKISNWFKGGSKPTTRSNNYQKQSRIPQNRATTSVSSQYGYRSGQGSTKKEEKKQPKREVYKVEKKTEYKKATPPAPRTSEQKQFDNQLNANLKRTSENKKVEKPKAKVVSSQYAYKPGQGTGNEEKKAAEKKEYNKKIGADKKSKAQLKLEQKMQLPDRVKTDTEMAAKYHPHQYAASRGLLSGVTLGGSKAMMKYGGSDDIKKIDEDFTKNESKADKRLEFASEMAGNMATYGASSGISKAAGSKMFKVADRIGKADNMSKGLATKGAEKVEQHFVEKYGAKAGKKMFDALKTDVAINSTTGLAHNALLAANEDGDLGDKAKAFAGNVALTAAMGTGLTVLPTRLIERGSINAYRNSLKDATKSAVSNAEKIATKKAEGKALTKVEEELVDQMPQIAREEPKPKIEVAKEEPKIELPKKQITAEELQQQANGNGIKAREDYLASVESENALKREQALANIEQYQKQNTPYWMEGNVDAIEKGADQYERDMASAMAKRDAENVAPMENKVLQDANKQLSKSDKYAATDDAIPFGDNRTDLDRQTDDVVDAINNNVRYENKPISKNNLKTTRQLIKERAWGELPDDVDEARMVAAEISESKNIKAENKYVGEFKKAENDCIDEYLEASKRGDEEGMARAKAKAQAFRELDEGTEQAAKKIYSKDAMDFSLIDNHTGNAASDGVTIKDAKSFKEYITRKNERLAPHKRVSDTAESAYLSTNSEVERELHIQFNKDGLWTYDVAHNNKMLNKAINGVFNDSTPSAKLNEFARYVRTGENPKADKYLQSIYEANVLREHLSMMLPETSGAKRQQVIEGLETLNQYLAMRVGESGQILQAQKFYRYMSPTTRALTTKQGLAQLFKARGIIETIEEFDKILSTQTELKQFIDDIANGQSLEEIAHAERQARHMQEVWWAERGLNSGKSGDTQECLHLFLLTQEISVATFSMPLRELRMTLLLVYFRSIARHTRVRQTQLQEQSR